MNDMYRAAGFYDCIIASEAIWSDQGRAVTIDGNRVRTSVRTCVHSYGASLVPSEYIQYSTR